MAGPTSAKNMSLSASQMLGYGGDQLQQQLEDEVEEQKKRALAQPNQQMRSLGQSMTGQPMSAMDMLGMRRAGL